MTIDENIENLEKQLKEIEIMYYKIQGGIEALKGQKEAEKNKGKKGEK